MKKQTYKLASFFECPDSQSLSMTRLVLFITTIAIVFILLSLAFEIAFCDTENYTGIAAIIGAAGGVLSVMLGAKSLQKKYEK